MQSGLLDNTIRWIPGLLELPAWCAEAPVPTQPRPSAFSLSGSASSGLYLSLPLATKSQPQKATFPRRGPGAPITLALMFLYEALIVHHLWCHHCAHGARAPGPFPEQSQGSMCQQQQDYSLVMAGEMAAASTANVQAQRVGSAVRGSDPLGFRPHSWVQ